MNGPNPRGKEPRRDERPEEMSIAGHPPENTRRTATGDKTDGGSKMSD